MSVSRYRAGSSRPKSAHAPVRQSMRYCRSTSVACVHVTPSTVGVSRSVTCTISAPGLWAKIERTREVGSNITPEKYNEDLYLYDYDFYTVKECDNFYAPLAHTPEVFFNMIREMDFSLSCVAAKAKLYKVPERNKIDVVLDEESRIFKNSMWLRNKLIDSGYDVDQKETFIGTKKDLIQKYMK